MDDRQRLEAIVSVINKYLPPDGIPINDAMSEIISLVDPLPAPQPVQEPVAWTLLLTGEHHPRVYQAITAIKEALAQPAQGPFTYYDPVRDAIRPFGSDGDIPLYTEPPQREWNAALDEAAARIGEIKGFGKATQDSFAVYIKGLKR